MTTDGNINTTSMSIDGCNLDSAHGFQMYSSVLHNQHNILADEQSRHTSSDLLLVAAICIKGSGYD